MMKTNTLRLLSLPGLLFAPAAAHAAEVMAEGFDEAATAHVETNAAAAGSATFVDYASMTVGTTLHNIPEAPRMVANSQPARGLLLKVDHTLTFSNDRLVNIVALDDNGGTRITLLNNYRLKFDFYLRVSPAVIPNTNGFPPSSSYAGTTEQMLWGVGYTSAAGSPMGRQWRSARGSGTWGLLSTEGGHGSSTTLGSDASLFVGNTLNGARNMDLIAAPADTANYFTPAFGANASPLPHCPANQWVQADITVLGGQVTVQYQAAGRTAVKFFENIPGNVAGGLMVGYEDSFSSASFDRDNQWMLLDNMVVEDLTPPTMTVVSLTPPVSYTGQSVGFSYTVNNARQDGDLTISAVNFTGANAADFSVVTPLPLVVPANQSATLELAFHPLSGPNGVRTAGFTIVSDDPQSPSFNLSGLAARRSVPAFLAAHYRLDEAGGTTFADASGNGFPGGAQVREPLVFAQPGLLGAGGAGTAIGFLPAQTGTTGNYFAANVTHTPSFSASLWIKPAETGATRTLFQRDPDFDSTYDEICGLLLDTSGRLAFRVNSAEVLGSDTFPSGILSGQTYHVVLTHLDSDGFGNDTAARSRLYINGRLIAEKTGADAKGFGDYPINPTVGALHIASSTVAGRGYSGDMDDVQLYGMELTKEQVWGLYQSPGTTAADGWFIAGFDRGGDPLAATVTVPSSPDGTYQLYRSSLLSGWEPVGDPVTGAAAAQTVLTDPAPPAGNTFYRVMRQ